MCQNPNPTPFDPLLGPVEVAEIAGVSRATSWKWMNEGSIGPVVDLSSPGAKRLTLKIRKSDLYHWLRDRQREAVK